MPTRSSDEIRQDLRSSFDASLSLAVARYLRDHPAAPSGVRAWLDDADARWLEADDAAFSREATARLEALQALRGALAEVGDPGLSEELRVELAHATLNYQSARSGSFETAAGSLRDFLADAGEAPMDLDIH